MIVQAKLASRERILAALGEILGDPCERRTEERAPYFGPVTLRLPHSSGPDLSAFARDVSPLGVGLVHLMPLVPGEVLMYLRLPLGTSVRLRTEILWCRGYEDGWYASGGRFLDVT